MQMVDLEIELAYMSLDSSDSTEGNGTTLIIDIAL